MRILLSIILTSFWFVSFSQNKRDSVSVKNSVFSVIYSEKLEQPHILFYKSTNRETKVNRGSTDFYTEPKIHTSDNLDYKNNIYDKGHLAPAATFSDNSQNLLQTFSYLNCALQNQYLNRGEWRILEETERKWDDQQNLKIYIRCIFTKNSKILSTGATVPDFFEKHVFFEKEKKWKCFLFPNEKPSKGWESFEITCKTEKHQFSILE